MTLGSAPGSARRATGRIRRAVRPLWQPSLAATLVVLGALLSAASTPLGPPAGETAGPVPTGRAHVVDAGSVAPIVVVGASIAAGTGSSAGQAWPTLLGRCLRRPVIVRAVPGAGYVAPGRAGGGPVGRLLDEVPIAAVRPPLVIIQAGHNDIGTDPAHLASAVRADVTTVRRLAPRTHLVLLTVFTAAGPVTATALRTDTTIVDAARGADPAVVVVDPLAERWSFPRVRDDLHPTSAGQEYLAHRLLSHLAADGVLPPAAPAAPGFPAAPEPGCG